jgi:hypothetical protein
MQSNDYHNASPPYYQPQHGGEGDIDPTVRENAEPELDYGESDFANPYEPTEMIQSDEVQTMAWLVFTGEGSRYGDMVRLVGKSVVIGRDNECEVQLQDRTASRQHAKIRIERQDDEVQYMLHDLATDNGTFVNGARIPQPTRLNNGDIVRIGYTELMFKVL